MCFDFLQCRAGSWELDVLLATMWMLSAGFVICWIMSIPSVLWWQILSFPLIYQFQGKPFMVSCVGDPDSIPVTVTVHWFNLGKFQYTNEFNKSSNSYYMPKCCLLLYTHCSHNCHDSVKASCLSSNELEMRLSRFGSGSSWAFNRHWKARPCKWPQPYDPDFDLS